MPTLGEGDRALTSDLAWVASSLGSAVAEVALVSPLRGWDRPRAAFRLTLADGRKLKLRRLPRSERAAELARLAERLRHLGIPQVVLRRAGTLLIDWIDGTPLPTSPAHTGRIEEAAQLLARIHQTPWFEGIGPPGLRSTRPALLAMQEELSVLVQRDRLDSNTAERLSALAHECAPGLALHGLVHGDFCAENLVVDADQRLRVVDNEGLEVGPLALDLARVWSRWPMPDPAWQRFLTVYRSRLGPNAPAEDLLVWKLRSLVRSAWYRVTDGLAGEGEALAKLRDLLDAV